MKSNLYLRIEKIVVLLVILASFYFVLFMFIGLIKWSWWFLLFPVAMLAYAVYRFIAELLTYKG